MVASTNDCLLDGQHTTDDLTVGVNLVVEILQLLLEILSPPLVKPDLGPVKAVQINPTLFLPDDAEWRLDGEPIRLALLKLKTVFTKQLFRKPGGLPHLSRGEAFGQEEISKQSFGEQDQIYHA
jgi:hypothetical protein